jgi:hypothetical protein
MKRPSLTSNDDKAEELLRRATAAGIKTEVTGGLSVGIYGAKDWVADSS